MSDCQKLEPLVTPYVDGEAAAAERGALDAHLRVCPPCRTRVEVERAVRTLLHARKDALARDCAPASLRARCAAAGRQSPVRGRQSPVDQSVGNEPQVTARRSHVAVHRPWRARAMPLALAASLTLVVGGAFLYEATSRSSRLMAAELAADHVKCFAANRALDSIGVRRAGVNKAPYPAPDAQRYLAAAFGWDAHLPELADLSLEAARPCLYGEGRVAHVMYRYGGQPVSLFMLPGTARREELLDVMGHEAAIWSAGGRTFVLIARESREEMRRLSAALHKTVQ